MNSGQSKVNKWASVCVQGLPRMSPSEQPGYTFVAKDADGRSAELSFRQHDDVALEYYRGVWHKLSQAVQKRHQLAGSLPAPAWTTWKPWEWCVQTPGHESRQKFVAWLGDDLAGFLNVWPDFPSICQSGKKVLYVEH